MNPSEHDELRGDLGVYVLGALEPPARQRLERHLGDCSRCRDDLSRMAVLPGLLQRVQEEQPSWDAGPPPAEPVLARIAAERRRSRWLLRATAVTAAFVAALAVGQVVAQVIVGQGGGRGNGPVIATYVATLPEAAAVVESRPWGSAVAFEAEAMPAGDGYVLVAVAADGHRAQVATWSDVDRSVRLDGSCYMASERIERFEVVAAGSEQVVAVLQPR